MVLCATLRPDASKHASPWAAGRVALAALPRQQVGRSALVWRPPFCLLQLLTLLLLLMMLILVMMSKTHSLHRSQLVGQAMSSPGTVGQTGSRGDVLAGGG